MTLSLPTIKFKYSKRSIARFFVSLVLLLQIFESAAVNIAYAQEVATTSANVSSQVATDSAQPVATPSASPTPSPSLTPKDSTPENNPFMETPLDKPELTDDLDYNIPQPTITLWDNESNTPRIRGKHHVRNLDKKIYSASEPVNVIVDNADSQEVGVRVLDNKGQVAPLDVAKSSVNGETTVTVKPSHSFRPGKYTLQVLDNNGQVISQQDFSWGVLAINTDKSVYRPHETAHLSLGVLDNRGDMVCDAKVTVMITDPQGHSTSISTADKSIQVNTSVCKSHAYSDQPDYWAVYNVQGAGNYSMTVAAETKNGSYTVTDSFSVQDNPAFDVARSGPTRIYPENTYPVTLAITANQDFQGVITELVPESFEVTQASNSAQFTGISDTDAQFMSSDYTDEKPVLRMPFNGSYKETQGFGEALTDPEEQQLYKQFGLLGHDGIDYALPSGTTVVAADEGEIVLAGDGAYGLTVVIQHKWGKSYYGHLSKITVKTGQHVYKGDSLGLSGSTGMSTGPHLHFGIKPNRANMDNGYYGKIDPSPYLGIVETPKTLLGASAYHITNGVKAISWNVNLKKGDKLTLGYNFKAPPISPEFYTLGPLRFTERNGVRVFKEERQWQIAADAVSGQMNLIFHRDSTDASGYTQYNAMTLTGQEASTDTATSASTTTTNASPPTQFCEASTLTGSSFNDITLGTATKSANDCAATFISSPVGQTITISNTDGNSVQANLWLSQSSTQVLVPTIVVYRWNGSSSTLASADLIATLTYSGTLGSSAALISPSITNPSNSVTLNPTDRLVAIVYVTVSTQKASSTAQVYFDNTARSTPSGLVLDYTMGTPNKPALTGSYDDDFTTAAASTNCATGGITYNTKWTCVSNTSGATLGSFTADVSGGANSSQWLTLTAPASASLGNEFGSPTANTGNTYIYQSHAISEASAQITTVVNSTMNASNTSTSPYSHSGLFLWYDATHWIELAAGYDGTSIGVWTIDSTSGTATKGTTTAVSAYNRIWLRWQKTGTSYQASYSIDGSTFTNVGSAISYAAQTFGREGLTVYDGIASTNYGAAFEYFSYQLPASSTINQRAGAILNDEDGSKITDTSGTGGTYSNVKVGERMRVRIQTDTGSGYTVQKVLKLQYDKNSNGTWTDVTPTAEIRPAGSTVLRTSKTKLGSGGISSIPCTGGTTARHAWTYQNSGVTDAVNVYASSCREFGFLVDTKNASVNTTYRFRLYNSTDNVVLTNYYAYPTISTVASSTTRYSKANVTSIASATSDLKNMLDKAGYSNVNTSDTAKEILQNVQNNITGITKTGANANTITNGEQASDFGYSVAVGDVNGDGYADVVVGSYFYSSSTGRAYIFYGQKGGINVSSAASANVILTGEASVTQFGNSVAVGDVNGDGYADVVVGANAYSSNTGRTYVFYGSATLSGSIAATSANVILTGETSSQFGNSVAVGDVNGDGYADVVVGGSFYSTSTGRTYVFYGSATLSGSIAATSANVILTGESINYYFGNSVAVGDVNGDGYADVVVGSYGGGRTYTFLGSYQAHTTFDRTVTGETGSSFGAASAMGDINGDGYQDIAVGAYGYNSLQGRVYIQEATTSAHMIGLTGATPNAVNNANATYTGETTPTATSQFGTSVAIGDVNGDGYADTIVGAPAYNSSTGRVYVFYGGPTLTNKNASSADVILTGETTSTSFGRTVAVGDVNGDGYADVIVGATSYSSSKGRVYVFYGGPNLSSKTAPGDVTYTGAAASDSFGRGLTVADLNGDGFKDVVVGAYGNTSNTGKVYIFNGSSSMTSQDLSAAGSANVTLTGETPTGGQSWYFGISLASGDVNGDGYQDLLVGAWGYNSNQGRAYLFYGGPSLSSKTASSADAIYTGASGGDQLGSQVGIGDINGDGYKDVLAAAPGYSAGGSTGRVYVFYGAPKLVNEDLSSTGTPDLTLTGEAVSSSFGDSISSGDINGDGYDDLVIGADGYSTATGREYIILGGGSSEIPTMNFASSGTSGGTCGPSTFTGTWQGQSSVAASSSNLLLQVYHISASSWETVQTNSTLAANTPGTLTGSPSGATSEYKDGNGLSYWRVYQASGQETLSTDAISVTGGGTGGSVSPDDLMRHGAYFCGGALQPFSF